MRYRRTPTSKGRTLNRPSFYLVGVPMQRPPRTGGPHPRVRWVRPPWPRHAATQRKQQGGNRRHGTAPTTGVGMPHGPRTRRSGKTNGPVAQPAEHGVRNAEAAGSTPARSTKPRTGQRTSRRKPRELQREGRCGRRGILVPPLPRPSLRTPPRAAADTHNAPQTDRHEGERVRAPEGAWCVGARRVAKLGPRCNPVAGTKPEETAVTDQGSTPRTGRETGDTGRRHQAGSDVAQRKSGAGQKRVATPRRCRDRHTAIARGRDPKGPAPPSTLHRKPPKVASPEPPKGREEASPAGPLATAP